jgi:hypothetical protein
MTDHDDGDVIAGCPALIVDGGGRDPLGDGGGIAVAELSGECRQPPLPEKWPSRRPSTTPSV